MISKQIQQTIAPYPKAAQSAFGQIRTLIYQTAASRPEVGPLTETLKWGEPGYLTQITKSGTTIRLAWKPKHPDHLGLFVNCRTTLIDTIKTLYPLKTDGNRAVMIPLNEPLPTQALGHLITLAQTYHLKRPLTDPIK